MYGFPDSESGKHCLVETKILGFGIRNRTKGVRNPTDQVPLTRIHYWNPESTAWNPESKTDSLTWGDIYERYTYRP